MIYSELGDSLLLKQFREFYGEVIALKQTVFSSSAAAQPVVASMPDGDAEGSDGDRQPHGQVAEVFDRLLPLLDQQHRVAIQLGGEYWVAYEEARYVMAALADEIFLHSHWPGRYSYSQNLLEERLFSSHVAGEKFFHRVDKLMENRDPVRIELAKIYLMALALGFQGRYRGSDPKRRIADYRGRLYSFIFQASPHLDDSSTRLFPDTYRNTLDAGGELRLLPPVRKWLWRLAGAVGVYLLIQQLLWRYLTGDVREILRQILTPFAEN